MSAKEMFEEFDFEKITILNSFDKIQLITYKRYDGKIVFDIENKELTIRLEDIEVDILKAINKQVEELGWKN